MKTNLETGWERYDATLENNPLHTAGYDIFIYSDPFFEGKSPLSISVFSVVNTLNKLGSAAKARARKRVG
ncbi:MAG: hypothetical protein MUO24_10845 [Desulfobacterales bacterium]|nr:hypothetical protein [Desulfobacterales bacterium]